MDIHSIKSGTYSVYISKSELDRRHMDPVSMTAAEALDIVSSITGSGAGPVQVELFPGRDELLIFVRKGSSTPEFFEFDDIENLIHAISNCECGLPSSLFFYEGRYVLCVRVWDNCPCADLEEFGSRLIRPAEFLLHLREHGKIITDGNAVSVLKKAFSRV